MRSYIEVFICDSASDFVAKGWVREGVGGTHTYANHIGITLPAAAAAAAEKLYASMYE